LQRRAPVSQRVREFRSVWLCCSHCISGFRENVLERAAGDDDAGLFHGHRVKNRVAGSLFKSANVAAICMTTGYLEHMAGVVEPVAVPNVAKTSVVDVAPRSLSAAGLRELAAVIALVTLADLTIYRGAGFGGLAVLFALSPALILLGGRRSAGGVSRWIVSAMLVLLAARLIWLGSVLGVLCGVVLLVAFTLALGGQALFLPNLAAGFVQLLAAGAIRSAAVATFLRTASPRLPRVVWVNFMLPLGAVVLFSWLFVQANPDLAKSISEAIRHAGDRLVYWLEHWSERLPEVIFWGISGYVAVGLVRPLLVDWFPASRRSVVDSIEPPAPQPAPLYAAVRNTLIAVIALFAVYLVFEFRTLWFREFPVGFYYAGYAHEGAAWLTAALAVATVTLSLIFSGRVMHDPRLSRLRWLAWIWSGLNLVLAFTVYHRLFIYIDFNGMTRMRTIGIFGISTVVAGFLLVIWKFTANRDFAWLIQRQLWALAIAIYAFSLTPVDSIVHAYNVRQILRGDLAPSVQITEHPINSEGYLLLGPLVDCDDAIIRDGIRALLAQEHEAVKNRQEERKQLGWTTFQAADARLLKKLDRDSHRWQDFRDDSRRDATINRFRKYAYQWY
jgi:hypothetical protein